MRMAAIGNPMPDEGTNASWRKRAIRKFADGARRNAVRNRYQNT
jgi:hypothetical protein